VLAACAPHEFKHVIFVPPDQDELEEEKQENLERRGNPPPSRGSNREGEEEKGRERKPVTEAEWRLTLLSAKRLVFLPLVVKVTAKTVRV
jgi:hypothetical protein